MTGYESKKAAAQAKLHEQYDDMYVVYLNGVYDGKKQRPWVGLTEEDWKEIEDMPDTFDQGVAWAQAKLKEKNT